MAKSKADIMKMDLYGILGVSPEASEKEIMKSYRKKALKCHPDKNPDNPKAAELFHELSKALEVLTDLSAKAAYDNVLRARKLAEERNRVLDSKRKKLKEDLEAREQSADQTRTADKKAEQNLLAEVERLRKEGSKLLEEMQQQMKAKLMTDLNDDSDSDETDSPKIKVRWSSKRSDACAYTEEDLRALFSRYGQIANILVSSKKKGSAIIEFGTSTPLLKLAENEVGAPANPLTVTWLSGKPSGASSAAGDRHTGPAAPEPMAFKPASVPQRPANSSDNSSSNINLRDYESLVLMKMRQAEERKRLIEQMQKEDEEENWYLLKHVHT